MISRRRVLKGGLALAGVAAGVSGGLVALRGYAPPVQGLVCLSRYEYRTVAKLATAILPEGGAFAAGASSFDLARRFDAYLADEPDEVRSDLSTALALLEYGPVVYDHHLVTFSNLDDAARLAHFEAWIQSDDPLRRQIALALRKFLCLVFYDDPQVWPGIGYGGPA